MFTGIVQSLGTVQSFFNGVLVVSPDSTWSGITFEEGESIAVNGVCLTVIPESTTDRLAFDLSPETLARTSLGNLSEGSRVNLERAATVGSHLGGHIVQGHVDATGKFVSAQQQENSVVMRFKAPLEYDRYLIDKGSVTLDGVSLTVVGPKDGEFDVWVIPHTLEKTTLGTLKPGDDLNMEFDVIAKYVEKLMAFKV